MRRRVLRAVALSAVAAATTAALVAAGPASARELPGSGEADCHDPLFPDPAFPDACVWRFVAPGAPAHARASMDDQGLRDVTLVLLRRTDGLRLRRITVTGAALAGGPGACRDHFADLTASAAYGGAGLAVVQSTLGQGDGCAGPAVGPAADALRTFPVHGTTARLFRRGGRLVAEWTEGTSTSVRLTTHRIGAEETVRLARASLSLR